MPLPTIETSGPAPAEPDYALAPDVILLPLHDGTARLLDLGGSFYAVPAVGAGMLRDTLDLGTAAAVRRAAEQYDVDVRQVQADLDTFLRRLEKEGLIRPRLARRGLRRSTTALALLILAPALFFAHRARPGPRARAAALLTLARLSFRLFGWSRTVAAWQWCHPRGVESPPANEWEATVRAIDEAVRQAAAGHALEVECKERSLCCWALARRAGVPAALVVGVALFPLAGHCWCESGPWMLGDDRDRCEAYTPVARYQ
jgi:hypothetical protein